MKLVLATAAAAAFATPALADLADTDWYVSGGYTVLDAEGSTIGGLTARGGGFFTEHFGAEAEFSFGVMDDQVGGVDVKLNTMWAGYAVASLPLAERLNLLGRLGYGTAEIEVSAPSAFGFPSVEASDDESGFLFGVAGEYLITERVAARLDYTRFDAEDGEADLFGASLVYRF